MYMITPSHTQRLTLYAIHSVKYAQAIVVYIVLFNYQYKRITITESVTGFYPSGQPQHGHYPIRTLPSWALPTRTHQFRMIR